MKTSDENRIVVELTTVRFLLVASSGQHFCFEVWAFYFLAEFFRLIFLFIIFSIYEIPKRKGD